MSLFFPDGLEFYPKHPSPIKTHKIQTSPMPMLEGQTAPFDATELCAKFENDLNGCLALYEDKRFDVTGIAIWVGRDIHDLPTVQLSDKVDGKCCSHCIFPKADILEQVRKFETAKATYVDWLQAQYEYATSLELDRDAYFRPD